MPDRKQRHSGSTGILPWGISALARKSLTYNGKLVKLLIEFADVIKVTIN
jgi:hypothetical protein